MPILAEFCYKNRVNKTLIYDWPEFNESINRLKEKKESFLERNGLENKVNATMAVFSLKQLGWKDRQEEQERETAPLKIIITKEGDFDTSQNDNIIIEEGKNG